MDSIRIANVQTPRGASDFAHCARDFSFLAMGQTARTCFLVDRA
jgi:hypothetical protein